MNRTQVIIDSLRKDKRTTGIASALGALWIVSSGMPDLVPYADLIVDKILPTAALVALFLSGNGSFASQAELDQQVDARRALVEKKAAGPHP